MSSFYKMDPSKWDFGTAGLSLEEEAAYLRIVNAIHKHDGPVPNNDRVLAGMFRVSTRKARALVEALVEAGKITIEGGEIWNDRARSDLVHRGFVSSSRAESGAKGGRTRAENAAKALKNNDQVQAIASSRIEENRIEVVAARDATPVDSQQDQTDREKLLAAMGADPTSGMIGPNGTRLGTMNDMAEARKWADLGLSLDDQCRLISERMAQQRGRNPSFTPRSFGYFSGAMSDFAARKSAPLPSSQANKPDDKAAKVARWERIAKGAA